MLIFALEGVVLFFVVVGLLAWIADSVGAAGFWSNFKDILIGLTRMVLVIGAACAVVAIMADFLQRLWTLIS